PAPNLGTIIIIMNKDVNEVKQIFLPILKNFGVTRAGIFGSLARNEAVSDSDVDLLVEIGKDISLLDFVGMKLSLEDAIGKKVDLVEYCTIKPLLKERILKEQIQIL
ncbi:MAG: nucleotidyltransferase family protein, partial [Candidatus Margulisiibacteriota bacterium]